MSGRKVRVDAAEEEAAAWHARLGTTVVATETLAEFFAWRASPANDEAYRRVEKLWKDCGSVAHDPAIVRALDQAMDGRSRKRIQSRRLIVGGGAAIAAGVLLAVSAALWWQTRGVFETSVGEQRIVQLADGSSIRLDTGTRVRVRLGADRRQVDLERGQALFTVAPDAQRPFVVEAGDAVVTAVGTVFDVRRNAADVRVTLVSGVVDVDVDTEGAVAPTRMAAGHQARVSGGGVETRPVDAAAETVWTDGRIVFRDTPLAQAVSEVNRYLTDKIELDAGAHETTPINGVFRAGDRDAFVSAASEGLGLRATAGPGGSVLLSERTK